uniref:Uncharacterized protein n=1 Tax=Vibrio sp. F12 FF_152 TaxID=1652829 RepID=A0A0H4A0G7_9VIBR|nr:hypothetical protein [Vibrio sp. F12 FF_152]
MKLFSLFLMLLVSLNASASSLPAWNNSAQLDALIDSFKQTYQEATHEFDKNK